MAAQAPARAARQAPERSPRPDVPPREAARAAAGTAHVRGRVFAVDSSQPVRFAQVRLTEPTLKISRTATADGAGRFDFDQLPAGRYTLVASKGGFVTLQFGQRRPYEPGTPVEVGAGETRELEFPLPRGSVIAGRVTDEAGDPVPHAAVSAMRFVYGPGGRRHLEPADGEDSTDDLGQFRLFGLMPGEYVVLASPAIPRVRDAAQGGARTGDVQEGYTTTYYPGVANAAEAAAVTVGLGQETSAYFGLVPARLARVSGVVTDAEGRPAAGGQVSVVPVTGELDDASGSTRVLADGSFVVAGLPPGEYLLRVRLEPRGGSRVAEAATHPLTLLSGVDVTGLSVVTAPGIVVSGTVVFNGSTNTGRSGLVVVPSAVDTRVPLGAPGIRASGAVGPDGRFRLGGLFGEVTFSLAGPGAATWTITGVTMNGRDVTDRPAAIDAGQPGTLRIVVSDQVTDVSGRVTDARGSARREFVAVFLPESLPAGVLPTRYVRTARPSQEGQFRVQGLPPGSYRVIATESLEEGREWDPAFQAWAREHGTTVRVDGGRTTSVDLQF